MIAIRLDVCCMECLKDQFAKKTVSRREKQGTFLAVDSDGIVACAYLGSLGPSNTDKRILFGRKYGLRPTTHECGLAGIINDYYHIRIDGTVDSKEVDDAKVLTICP
ncbi:jg14208 [Pararge aegeria aegeria]|uniref:Jg14208 protein n=1 Tax=Pararge aegeria aegeria TaxID=348720 RepID=A0A8S4R162_9NEOP|nr:jg14208 [Pararge aegeria aegeria]